MNIAIFGKKYDIAEKIYWWCVEEINRRIEIESGN